MLFSFLGRIYAVKIGTSHWREKVIKSVATQTVSNLCMHPPSYPSKVSNKNAKVSSTQQFKEAWATITRSSYHDRTRTKSWIFHQVTSPRCMIHVFKLGTSDNDPMPRQSLYVSRHLIFSRESRVWNPTCRTIPRPPAATQIPSHLGRFPKGSLYDPIHLFNPTHGQVVCQGQKLAGEGVWQGTHHGRSWPVMAAMQEMKRCCKPSGSKHELLVRCDLYTSFDHLHKSTYCDPYVDIHVACQNSKRILQNFKSAKVSLPSKAPDPLW